MNRIANQLGRVSTISAFAVAVVVASGALPTSAATPAGTAPACPGGDTGITLSPGFCATIFADNLGHIRHLVVTPDGIVYANSWSGRYYHNDKPPADGFLLALQDTDGTGRANVVRRFGATSAQGAAGGTGIAAIQIAKSFGCRVIATAGSERKLRICTEQGADASFDYSTTDWLEAVKREAGKRGVDVVIDPVGGSISEESVRCLA